MRNIATKLYVSSGLALMAVLGSAGVAHADAASAIDAATSEVNASATALSPFLINIGTAFLVLAVVGLAFRIGYKSIKAGKLSF